MNDNLKSNIMQILAPIFQSSITKICFHLQIILSCIIKNFWEIENINSVEDPFLLSWVSNTERNLSFNQLLNDYVQLDLTNENFTCIESAELNSVNLFYSDLQYSIVLQQMIESSMESSEIQNYQSMEISLCILISSVQNNGIFIDGSNLEKSISIINEYLKTLESHAKKLIHDENFSISSPNDISNVLFNKLNLLDNLSNEIEKDRLQKKPTTSKDTLIRLSPFHPLPSLILDYRTSKQLQESFISLLKYWKQSTNHGHRIFPNWHMTNSPTGRITITDPSLQTLSREKTIFTFPDKREFSIDIRDSLKPAAGFTFLSFDYTQLEIRILAHFCQDPTLIEYLKSGKDLHKLIASKWFNKSVNDVSDDDRQKSKEICYGK